MVELSRHVFWYCARVLVAVWLALALAATIAAAEPSTATAKLSGDFEREVQPIFAARCYECHGEQKQSGGLRLDVKSLALGGGESGLAIVPGKPAEARR